MRAAQHPGIQPRHPGRTQTRPVRKMQPEIRATEAPSPELSTIPNSLTQRRVAIFPPGTTTACPFKLPGSGPTTSRPPFALTPKQIMPSPTIWDSSVAHDGANPSSGCRSLRTHRPYKAVDITNKSDIPRKNGTLATDTRLQRRAAAKVAEQDLADVSKRRPFLLAEPSINSQRRGRLPWLDGGRSRQPSIPLAPGAFVEEDSLKYISAFEERRQDSNTGLAAIAGRRGGGHPGSRPLLRRNSQSTTTSIGSRRRLNRSLPTGAAEEIAVRATIDPTSNDSLSRPAIPLIALAKELYPTDTSVESESPTRERRKRFTSDSLLPPQPRAFPVGEQLSLRNSSPVFKGQTLESGSTRIDPASRKTSLSVQPLRADRVRPSSQDRSGVIDMCPTPSLSVQPIRSKTWKTLPTDDHGQGKPLRGIAPPSRELPHDLRNSISGLEALMQEAVLIASIAADQGQGAEVPAILAEAQMALKKASNIQNNQKMAMPRPLSASPNSSTSIRASPATDQCSATITDRDPVGRLRVINPAPAGPRASHVVPVVAADTQAGVRTVWDEDWPQHRLSGEETFSEPDSKSSPTHLTSFGQPANFDWAYASGSRDLYSLSSSSQKLPKGRAKGAVPQKYAFPNEPAASQPGDREHVTFVTRTLSSRDAVDQHIRQSNENSLLPIRSSVSQRHPSALKGTISPDADDEDGDSPSRGGSPNSPAPGLGGGQNWGRDKYDEKDYINDDESDDPLRGKHHVTLKEGESFSLNHGYKRRPIARNWDTLRKRSTASVACMNTALVGLLIGIYAGEVPAIQYSLADQHHRVILGNVVLYLAMGVVVFLFWPLPLLHGRKPYTIFALAIALPLQVPQAVVVETQRSTNYAGWTTGLLVSRALSGLALGFAHINFKATLLDLFGASLQSDHPHGEVVVTNDVRRHGGGMGLWLGIWSWCWIGSLAVGFLIGADIISGLDVSRGFYISIVLVAATIFLNVVTPETRRSPHRRTMQEVEVPNVGISRRVARGEIKMHVSGDGPKWWWEEVFAGVYLSFRMMAQTGFLVMALYMAWIYGQIVLIIVLLGNLLSAGYGWRPEYVGLGVLAIAVGALLAVPNSKANLFSRSRVKGPRTDSMTLEHRITWSSHLIRRSLFMIALPLAGLAYTLGSDGASIQYMVPIVFAGFIGYLSNLAIAECNGIIMETFDTCDLQPGANSRHRLMSLPPMTKLKRTNYSSYPRVSAGFFVSQSLAFMFAAAATGVGGAVTRKVGAQKTTAITAGILLLFTLLLISSLWRYREVQVIPNELFGHYFGSTTETQQRRNSTASAASDRSWRAVIIGNPSGKIRRMSWLELGSLSRWTEIRRLNRLLNRSTTQGLTPGWQ